MQNADQVVNIPQSVSRHPKVADTEHYLQYQYWYNSGTMFSVYSAQQWYQDYVNTLTTRFYKCNKNN